MNALQLRRLLISIHLYPAGFLAPAFLVVAIGGGLYLAGFEAEARNTPIELATAARLDLSSDTIEQYVRSLLTANGGDLEFE